MRARAANAAAHAAGRADGASHLHALLVQRGLDVGSGRVVRAVDVATPAVTTTQVSHSGLQLLPLHAYDADAGIEHSVVTALEASSSLSATLGDGGVDAYALCDATGATHMMSGSGDTLTGARLVAACWRPCRVLRHDGATDLFELQWAAASREGGTAATTGLAGSKATSLLAAPSPGDALTAAVGSPETNQHVLSSSEGLPTVLLPEEHLDVAGSVAAAHAFYYCPSSSVCVAGGGGDAEVRAFASRFAEAHAARQRAVGAGLFWQGVTALQEGVAASSSTTCTTTTTRRPSVTSAAGCGGDGDSGHGGGGGGGDSGAGTESEPAASTLLADVSARFDREQLACALLSSLRTHGSRSSSAGGGGGGGGGQEVQSKQHRFLPSTPSLALMATGRDGGTSTSPLPSPAAIDAAAASLADELWRHGVSVESVAADATPRPHSRQRLHYGGSNNGQDVARASASTSSSSSYKRSRDDFYFACLYTSRQPLAAMQAVQREVARLLLLSGGPPAAHPHVSSTAAPTSRGIRAIGPPPSHPRPSYSSSPPFPLLLLASTAWDAPQHPAEWEAAQEGAIAAYSASLAEWASSIHGEVRAALAAAPAFNPYSPAAAASSSLTSYGGGGGGGKGHFNLSESSPVAYGFSKLARLLRCADARMGNALRESSLAALEAYVGAIEAAAAVLVVVAGPGEVGVAVGQEGGHVRHNPMFAVELLDFEEEGPGVDDETASAPSAEGTSPTPSPFPSPSSKAVFGYSTHAEELAAAASAVFESAVGAGRGILTLERTMTGKWVGRWL